MTLGFKTGPLNWEVAKKIVGEDGATMCEIWFRIDRADEYSDMIAWLTQHGVRIGLHHWGVALGEYKTNLMTNHEKVRQATIAQIKQTIDIGSEINCAYVNIHPGARCLEKIDLTNQSQALVPDSTTRENDARRLLIEAARELTAYAASKKVLLTIETLPGAENHDFIKNEGWYDPGNASLSDMESLVSSNLPMANDITHTASAIARVNPEPESMWQKLIDFTNGTKQQTKLIHLNTMTPPFNGTDTHNGLLAEDWEVGAWPSRDQIIQLLSLFKHRDDVYVVPEPKAKAQENYRALKELAREAEEI